MTSVMVAFSVGVDSTFVLKVAQDAIGDRVLALTTTSPTMPDQDRQSALEMARLIGARHVLIESSELEVDGYARNLSSDLSRRDDFRPTRFARELAFRPSSNSAIPRSRARWSIGPFLVETNQSPKGG